MNWRLANERLRDLLYPSNIHEKSTLWGARVPV